jgi:LmbE family N-acetylglucosaminyl deacetylase
MESQSLGQRSSQLPHACLPPKFWGRILIVAAHPDDEVLALGGHFRSVHPRIFHLTTGAGFLPIRNLGDRRKAEVRRALALGGIPQRRITLGSVPDQGVALAIPELVGQLTTVIDHVAPDCLLTHAYEGGHPDHDGASLVCRLATKGRIPIYEFTSYHNGSPFAVKASLRTNRFLDELDGEVIVPLSKQQQRLKRKMLCCFPTQETILQRFSITEERFRPAPRYRYDKPPHAGTLLYESWGSPMDYVSWQGAVQEAMQKMDIKLND